MDSLTVKDALLIFYKDYQLKSDGGVRDPAVKVEILKGISLYIPNVEARKKVVLKHDIHHMMTGYPAVMKGEIEISAWELSTGCFRYWVPLTLNTYGMMMGIPFNLKGVWKAWVRGRRTKNLYETNYSNEELLKKPVGELKNELGLLDEGKQHVNIVGALVTFIGFVLFGTLFSIASVILIPVVLIYSLSVSIRNLWQKS